MKYRNTIIEVTDRCNLACKDCYRNYVNITDTDMSLDDFKEILELIEYPTRLILFSIGEPLLHPDYAEMVMLAGNTGSSVTIGTNGTIYREDVAKAAYLCDARVCISHDGLDYWTMRCLRANDPSIVVKNTFKYINLNIPVNVSLLRSTQEYSEIQRFIRYWLDNGVSCVIVRNMLSQEKSNTVVSSCKWLENEYLYIRADGSICLCERRQDSPIIGIPPPAMKQAEIEREYHRNSMSFCKTCSQAYNGEKMTGTVTFGGLTYFYQQDYFNQIFSRTPIEDLNI